jgi:fused signal recognition particle receptor
MSKDNKKSFFSFINKINIFKKKENKEDVVLKENQLNVKSVNPLSLKEKRSEVKKNSFFSFLKNKFQTTKNNLNSIFKNFFISKKIDSNFFKKIEEKLISADVNIYTIQKIFNSIKKKLSVEELKDSKLVLNSIIKVTKKIFRKNSKSLFLNSQIKPIVIILVGVNGSGKTTTVVKLCRLYKNLKKKILVAAADTFRSAAIDQLKKLCKKENISVISKKTGSDPSSVVYDAVQQSISKKFDVLIIDTAGRLHTKINLMNEIQKMIRVIKKINGFGPTEILLTIDSCTGQNALIQAEKFNNFLGITGLILTKFDGTAKGGIILSIADKFSIPIRYITSGESINDIYFFDRKDFIDSIFKF